MVCTNQICGQCHISLSDSEKMKKKTLTILFTYSIYIQKKSYGYDNYYKNFGSKIVTTHFIKKTTIQKTTDKK